MSNRKLLVVDDSESFQETIREVLVLSDFDVITANNGKEGLRKVYEDSPDLILLDCVMPEMDGYEMLATMRQDPLLVNKPVIMLTGKDNEFNEIKALTLGIDDYLIKPFNPDVLVARINAILERKTQRASDDPLALLCGKNVIRTEAERRLAQGLPFAAMFLDLNDFKSYNNRYGFKRGDEVIGETAGILLRAVRECGDKGDLGGHAGGDDFIILTAPERFKKMAEKIIEIFDASVAGFYDPDDRERGFIIATDRNNNTRKLPFLSIAIAVISTAQTRVVHYGQLEGVAAELKKLAKSQKHSAYAVDRRSK